LKKDVQCVKSSAAKETPMPFGYTGKILRVDLTHAKLEIEEPPESFYRKYMGGSAMGMYYILKEVPTGVEAAAPENVLTLMLSVTTGAPISGQSRLNVNAKSATPRFLWRYRGRCTDTSCAPNRTDSGRPNPL
jgi:hypothetical protein